MMFKKTVLAAGLLTLLASSAYAEQKFYFRYVAGGKTINVSQPELPVEPEIPQPEKKGVLNISNGYLSHSDYNGNGIIDTGDHVSVQWTLRNTGMGEIRGIATAAIFNIEDRALGYISWSGASTSLSCANNLAPGASMTCSTSMVVTDGIMPSNRSDAYFTAQFSMSMPENVDEITGNSTIQEGIPLGSELLLELKGSPSVVGSPQYLFSESAIGISFQLQADSPEPFLDYAVKVKIPELDDEINANCFYMNIPNNFTAMCNATLPINFLHKETIYEGLPDNYQLSYEIIQTKMAGFPTNKTIAEGALIEGPLRYGSKLPEISSFSVTAPATLDGNFEISAVIKNNSSDYLRGWEFDIDIGLDVKLKNICPDIVNFTPNQTVTCSTSMKLTQAQQNTIKSFFNSGNSTTLNYSVMLGKENGSESGVTTGPYGSIDISW